MEYDQLWKAALGEIELQISRANFITWMKNSSFIDKKDGIALIGLPNNFAKEWVEKKYHNIILGALRSLDATIKKTDYVVHNYQPPPIFSDKKNQNKNANQLVIPEFKIDQETNLNPRYTLNSFVVGSSNELAYAATMAVIQDIGKKYNPLFIYGGVGVGKTHLIQAVGNEIKNLYQNKVKVRYTPSEKFTNEVIWAMKNKRMETIKEKYRAIDVLIIDDIQFIGGKTRTEEEFFHTFNALYENNKQIIISSDRPPRFIPTLEERLRSRFEGGMIADIGTPDYELRMAVLKSKLQERGGTLNDDLISLIATKVQKNLRELEGVVNRIVFYQQVKNVQMTPLFIENIINETVRRPLQNISAAQIIKAVSDFFNFSVTDLTDRCRKKEVVEPRQIAMYLLREMMDLSYPYIGEKLGKRDHTTVIYSCEKIKQEINKNPALNQQILTIKDMIEKSVEA